MAVITLSCDLDHQPRAARPASRARLQVEQLATRREEIEAQITASPLVVELEALVRTRVGLRRARAWHWRDLDETGAARAVCLGTLDGHTFELAVVPIEAWWCELARFAVLEQRLLPAGGTPLPERVDVPWDLFVAQAEATSSSRPDLMRVLVSEYAGPADPTLMLDLLDRLDREAVGRLDARVRVGVALGALHWVRHADGWRELSPYRCQGREMVALRRVDAADLPRSVAALVGRADQGLVAGVAS